MRVLHTIAGLWNTTGGPASSVPGLCAALARRGHQITLLTGEGDLAPSVRRLQPAVRVMTASLGPYVFAHYSAEFAKTCRRLAEECDVLHTHGLWLHPNFATSRVGRDLGKPVVISPRGMLAPWALQHHRIVKRLMWTAAERKCLEDAAFVHATSAEEENEIRGMNVTARVTMIPNGIDLDEFPAEQIESLRSGGRHQTILFLSRIHPKKGLDLLLRAWRRIAPRHAEAKLVIAGPGEPQHIVELRKWLRDEHLERVEYLGAIDGMDKLRLLSQSAALALPSRNENYGMVVGEALACATPVIATTAVPWPELESSSCGWRVAVDADAIAFALDQALSLSSNELNAMGRRGREVIVRGHTTDIAAAAMEAAYREAGAVFLSRTNSVRMNSATQRSDA